MMSFALIGIGGVKIVVAYCAQWSNWSNLGFGMGQSVQ